MKDTLLAVLKVVLTVLLLPVVVATTFALQGELSSQALATREVLFAGMASYVLLRFFVYDFSAIYAFGQGMVTSIFQFLKPLVSAAPFVLPIYTFLTLAIYGILVIVGRAGEWEQVFLFLSSFTFTMHIVLTAQDLYAKDSAAGKPDYFFGMALVYILDVFLMALLMALAMKGFLFGRFFNVLTETTWGIYVAIFKQLF